MKICSKCKTAMDSVCSKNGEDFKFCPVCGGPIVDDDLYASIPDYYKDPYGIWKVSHKPENGSTKVLGTYTGYLDELALLMSDKINCCHDGQLIFSKLEEVEPKIPEFDLYQMANVKLDISKEFNSAPLESQIDAMKKILYGRPVDVINDKCTSKIIFTGAEVDPEPEPEEIIEVDNSNFATAFANLENGQCLKLREDVKLTQPLHFQNPTSEDCVVMIDGNGYTMTAPELDTNANMLTFSRARAVVKNLNIDANDKVKSVIHFYDSKGTNICENVTINKTGGVGSGIIVNGCKVVFRGKLGIDLPATAWQGIDIDMGSGVTRVPEAIFESNSYYTFKCPNDAVPAIKVGDNFKVNDYRDIVKSYNTTVEVTRDKITVDNSDGESTWEPLAA